MVVERKVSASNMMTTYLASLMPNAVILEAAFQFQEQAQPQAQTVDRFLEIEASSFDFASIEHQQEICGAASCGV